MLLKTVKLLLVQAVFCFSFALMANQDSSWASRTLETMSIDEKIGQLFMIAGYVDPEFAKSEIGNPYIIQEIDRYITDYDVGGIAFVGPSESTKQVQLTNHYQEISKYPILIAQDLEWGLGMRLKDGMSFPKNMTLGAVDDITLIRQMGKEIGRQAKLIGVHMNLSPVLDVNNEPNNVVINVRSFGSSPRLVSEKGIEMIQGLQEAGIIASAKHFPGLGDISVDPHLALPLSKHEKKRLDAIELFPFKQAIVAGVLSIQTEHLIIPALEQDQKTPSSLSPRVVHDLLKQELGFKGLVLSGALRMKALTNHFSNEEIVLKAFLAGHDMLLMPQDFPKAYQVLKSAFAEGKISEQAIDERVLKILQLKEKVHLEKQRLVSIPSQEELHSLFAKELKRKLYQSAVSVIRDQGKLIPHAIPDHQAIAYIQLGEANSTDYLENIRQSRNVDSYFFPLNEKDLKEEHRLFQHLDQYPLLILAIYPVEPSRISAIRLLNEKNQKEELKNFRVHGLTESILQLVEVLKPHQSKTLLTYFGNPFGLHFFDAYSTVLMAHEADQDAQQAAANLVNPD